MPSKNGYYPTKRGRKPKRTPELAMTETDCKCESGSEACCNIHNIMVCLGNHCVSITYGDKHGMANPTDPASGG